MKRFSPSDLSVGIFFFLLGFLIFFETHHFPLNEGNIPGPRYWPRSIALGFIILSLLLVFRGIYSKRVSRVQANVRNVYQQKVITLLITTILYIFFWSTFGFLLPTILFLLVVMVLFESVKDIGFLIKSLLYSSLITLFLYGCFYLGLHVPLD